MLTWILNNLLWSTFQRRGVSCMYNLKLLCCVQTDCNGVSKPRHPGDTWRGSKILGGGGRTCALKKINCNQSLACISWLVFCTKANQNKCQENQVCRVNWRGRDEKQFTVSATGLQLVNWWSGGDDCRRPAIGNDLSWSEVSLHDHSSNKRFVTSVFGPNVRLRSERCKGA